MKTQWIFLLAVTWTVLILTGGCRKKDPPTLPVLTTTVISEITLTTASGGGTISSDGGAPITARGVCWSIHKNPVISDPHTVDGAGTGKFTSMLTGLTPDTTWFVRAYASNSAGTSYGNEVEFITLPNPVFPTVTTNPVMDITLTTALCGGNVISDGGAAVTSRGICWSTGQTPTILDHKTIDGTGTGSFSSSITGLDANTPYYVRAYATNSVGTGYGDTVSFVRILPDSIEYTAIIPEFALTSVSYWDPPTLQYNCEQPVPQNSVATKKLDVDNDGNFDLMVKVSNWYEFHSASEPCNNFMYYSDIRTLVPGDSVAITNLVGNCAVVMNSGDTISSSLNFSEKAETVRHYWMAFSCGGGVFYGDKYFGFKIQKGNGYMYGWLLMNYYPKDHVVTIKSFALNKTVNHKILAGQTK